MANALFDPGREGFLAGEIDWDTAVIKPVLMRSYTFVASHKFLSDATGAGGSVVVATASCPALASKTVTNGVADAADSTFTAVAAGASITSILIIQASAVTGGADVAATAQRLIAYIDSATNFPITPNGGDITIAWDNAANKIFKL
jgi:hypothetical protein